MQRTQPFKEPERNDPGSRNGRDEGLKRKEGSMLKSLTEGQCGWGRVSKGKVAGGRLRV